MRCAAGSLFLIALGGCAARGPAAATDEIYAQAVQVAGYGFRCSGRDAIAFDAQLAPLIPWLEGELGRERVAEVRATMAQNLATTDFLTCPTAEDRARARARIRSLLGQLRARRTA